MMKNVLFALLFLALSTSLLAKSDTIVVSDSLKIVPLSKTTYLHISYLDNKGKSIPCNGLLFVKNGEAIVMDTPTGNEAAADLIHWVNDVLRADINFLVINHFHEDCMGGMLSFVGSGCQTISHKNTCKLAGIKGYHCAQRYFTDTLELVVGGEKIISYFFGPAHTRDNIVTYIPSERILFGGCMIKCLGADKGYLYDADQEEWPITVGKVKAQFPKVKTVIPGHGKPGNKKLFDYTINLFS
jgi:metallo-beta-lactamase class B